MRKISLLLALALLSASTSQSFAYNYSAVERKAQQDACEADAMRLCKDDVPDENKIIACMVKQKNKLSPRCLKIFNNKGHV